MFCTMLRMGWTGRAVVIGLLAGGVAGLSWIPPLGLLGLVVTFALLLTGWYCLFRSLAQRLIRGEGRLTGLRANAGPRAVCAALSVGATLVWLRLEPQEPAAGLVFVLLAAIPLGALVWLLAGTAASTQVQQAFRSRCQPNSGGTYWGTSPSELSNVVTRALPIGGCHLSFVEIRRLR